MTTPEEIKKHPREDLVKILGQGITDQIFDQIEPRKRSADTSRVDGERTAGGQSTLFRFG
jgi:hypothetical protein